MRLALLALLGVGSAFALLSPFPAPRSLLAPANAEPKDRAKDRERWPLQRFLRTVRFFNAQSAPGWAVSLLDRAIGGSAPAPPTADSAARPLLVVIGAHMDQAAAQLVSALRSSARNAVLLADPLAPPQVQTCAYHPNEPPLLGSPLAGPPERVRLPAARLGAALPRREGGGRGAP